MGKLANPYRLGTVYHNITQEKPLMYGYQWVVEFVGGGGFFLDQNFKRFTLFDKDENDPASCFAYWVVDNVSIPKFDIAQADVNFYSNGFHVPACRKYEHKLQLNILVDQDLTMYSKLDTWLKMISRLNIDGGGIKLIPTVKLRVMLLNNEHTYFTDSFVFEGCWIDNLAKLDFKYNNGTAEMSKVATSFQYQYVYRDPELDLANDPLNVSKILTAAGTVN